MRRKGRKDELIPGSIASLEELAGISDRNEFLAKYQHIRGSEFVYTVINDLNEMVMTRVHKGELCLI